MDDTISRQALLDKFEQWQKTEDYSNDEWNLLVDILSVIKSMPPAPQLGTNLAEVGTDLATKRAVKGFPIDADLLMLKVEEEYGFRARDRLYEIIRYMPKYELPSAEPVQCEDVVSREKVKELAYGQIRSEYSGIALKEQREAMLRIADNVIGLLPSVTPKQRTGKWIHVSEETWKCDQCGEISCCSPRYCPDCGSRNEVTE